ncbi:hypothetical protein MMC14_009566, partial [Varicellaria rhodocarpa]|nr:hypothetical protein [Varicellaria rhodocarpa]
MILLHVQESLNYVIRIFLLLKYKSLQVCRELHIIELFKQGPRRLGKNRPGPQYKLTDEHIKQVRDGYEGNYIQRNKNWEEQHKAAQKKFRSEPVKEQRDDWSEEHVHWPDWKWKYVRFSDETHAHHGSRYIEWVVRGPRERFKPDCIQVKLDKGPTEIHVSAIIGWNFKSKLMFYGKGADEPT